MKTPEYQYPVSVLMFIAATVILSTIGGYFRWLLLILIIVIGSAIVIAIERSGRRR
jgi:uncharacterized membrane protein